MKGIDKENGGSDMDTVIEGKSAKEKNSSLYNSLQKAFEQVKLHKKGKIKLDTWEEYKSKKNGE